MMNEKQQKDFNDLQKAVNKEKERFYNGEHLNDTFYYAYVCGILTATLSTFFDGKLLNVELDYSKIKTGEEND